MADPNAWGSGWDGHERAQLRRWARLSLAEKLAWLEDAQIFADRVKESRSRKSQNPL